MSYLETYSTQVDQFVAACNRLSALMYVTGEGGNLAWRLEPDTVLLTPTRLNKGLVTRADVVFVDMQGRRKEGTRNPTGELPMYMNFFGARPDIVTVVHCHPPYTNAFAISRETNYLERPFFPETTTEVGPVPLVPYAEPLTQRLADNFTPFLQKYNAFLMENHGLVIMSGRDITWTMMMTELLEMTSVSLTAALAMGPVKEIPRDGVERLDNIMKVRELPYFGAPGVNQSLIDVYYG
jgi:L-fuculose-phosphate aldolase